MENKVIRPSHYQGREKDLFDEWHERYSNDDRRYTGEQVFIEIMKCVAERYTRRYPQKIVLICQRVSIHCKDWKNIYIQTKGRITMKNKFKKAFIGGAIMATGLGVGYAASTAFQDLDAIRDNFDYILNQNTNKQAEIDGLNITIAELEAQIVELEQNQNSSGKQERIKELEEQVAGLITERDGLLAGNLELETAVNDLRIYTDMFVDVDEVGE